MDDNNKQAKVSKAAVAAASSKPSQQDAATLTNQQQQKDSDRHFLQRYREQPTPDPSEPPINRIRFYLDRYKIKEASQIFFHFNTLKLFSDDPDFMWEIIPLICKRLRGLCQYRFRVFEGCERMLCRIATDENCNPKEILISMLAELSQPGERQDDNVFRAMIRPLEGTLLRMSHPTPRDANFRWVLDVLMRYINEIELPQYDYDIGAKTRLSLPSDQSVKRFVEVLPLMLNFIIEFSSKPLELERTQMPILTESQIDEVLNGELVDDDFMSSVVTPLRSEYIDASAVALLSLLFRQITFLDITQFSPDLKACANRCVNTLVKLMPDLFAPIYKCAFGKAYLLEQAVESPSSIWSNTNIANSVDEETVKFALATCSYLLKCTRTLSNNPLEVVQSFPQILTPEASLICYISSVVVLVSRSEIFACEKGLLLLESLLLNLKRDSLGKKYLELVESAKLFENLVQTMV